MRRPRNGTALKTLPSLREIPSIAKERMGVERIGEFEVHYNKLDVPHIFIFELEPRSVLILRGARPVCYAHLARNVLQVGSIEEAELCVEQLELALGGAT